MTVWIGISSALAFLLFCDTAAAAPATLIELRAEAPAYAGMPIWLDVRTRDGCLEQAYWQDGLPAFFGRYGKALFAGWGTSVDVQWQGHHATPSGWYLDPMWANGPGGGSVTCPAEPMSAPPAWHRFPLHMFYKFDAPGVYSVRWNVTDFRGNSVAASAPTDLIVLPATPARREAWIGDMLAHPPADAKALAGDYIPALVAAWQDTRANHRFLELLCEKDAGVSFAALEALANRVDNGSQRYFVDLVKRGCLGPAVPAFIQSMRAGPVRDARTELAHIMVGYLQPGHAERYKLALQVLTNFRPVGWQVSDAREPKTALHADRDYLAWSDAQVLQAAPRVIGAGDDEATLAWVKYFSWDGPVSAGVHDQLRLLATQPGRTGQMALLRVAGLGDSADLPLLTKLFLQPREMGKWDFRDDSIPTAANTFGARAIPMLEKIAVKSDRWQARGRALRALERLGAVDFVNSINDPQLGPGGRAYGAPQKVPPEQHP